MTQIDLYNQAGEKVNTLNLNEAVFAVKVNEGLMHQALIRQQSNARYNLAKALTRAGVRGGGAKPYRQKGTGRARQGTIRAPHMSGGGVVFGPTGKENYTTMLPKKQRRLALFSALTLRAQAHKIFALDKYEGEIKTKVLAELITKLPVKRNLLLILSEKNSVLEKSAHNIPSVKIIQANYLNIEDLLKYQAICLVDGADKKIEEIFLK